MNNQQSARIVSVTLNPAVDQTLHFTQFNVGQVNRVSKIRLDPAGKGVNVAKVLNSLGCEVTVTGFLGRKNSRVFEEYFQIHKINNHFVKLDGTTRVNIKIVDETNEQVSEINYPGIKCSASNLLELKSTIKKLADESKIFVLSGSLPEGAPKDIYQEFIRIIKSHDCKVFLDSSGDALKNGIMGKPDVIKPNVDELSQLMGRPLEQEADVLKAIDELIASGISEVVVSLGEKGSLAADSAQRLLVRSPDVQVRSTVGAGDALVAGLVLAEAKGMTLEEQVRWGTAVAAASVAQPGTQAGPLEDVLTLLPKVIIKELKV
ncbi:fructose-1-phosphate kinase [Desulfosporosinus acidiphilus SJ4]|uniref:Tagatose-6-phosphate kinase n=1 Tax=Desulfosporosinus acidiphilus (strain DSM 22704 / JCM 16185 / SJ4) TaxID=646529 RepID=I4DB39_DESAJ|nr:1-phosphofructokinase [Desulfosporosinus acidiphilus]AFM43013.1 fructose-1-phosphate kinase [Desulfosporosinus acidiphilus SJ4]